MRPDLVEEARPKAEQEERTNLKGKEEARLAKDARHELKEHEHARPKVEEWVRLALEARRRAKEGDLGLKARRGKAEI